MNLRAATLSDAPLIARLWSDMIANSLATFTTTPKTTEDIEMMIDARRGAVWVAQGGGGFVTWGPFRSGPGYAHTVEHTIITATPGQGIGRALLSHAVHAATKQGHHAMIAGISGTNPAAIGFHKAMGFEQVGFLPQVGRKNATWLDLVLMQKLLISD